MINEHIILHAQRGDTRAFQQIVEEYHGLLWRTVRILLRNPVLTEDILQEAWIDVWKGLPSLQNHLALRSWLLTVVSNRCHMALRRAVLTTVSLESAPDALLLPSDIEDALEKMTRLEASANLRCALARLSIDQRRILELRYFAELELSEIALMMSLPLGTVKSRQHRALQSLRNMLQAKKEEIFS